MLQTCSFSLSNCSVDLISLRDKRWRNNLSYRVVECKECEWHYVDDGIGNGVLLSPYLSAMQALLISVPVLCSS